jgi:sulfite reductase (NADPH) flavoprotein alpha-component
VQTELQTVMDEVTRKTGADISPAGTVHILFGSQTGNAERLAHEFESQATRRGVSAVVTELNEFGVARLAEVPLVVVLCSTYNEGNEGDMPDNAVVFWRALAADDAPRLENLRYAVLALGDDGYFDFCHAGQLIDERLAELGACRLSERVDCDIYYEEDAEAWTGRMVDNFAEELPTVPSAGPSFESPEKPTWDRSNPFPARLVQNVLLSKEGSDKEVRHYEIDLSGSGIEYTAGDSIAVQPVNDPALVELFLETVAIDAEFDVEGETIRERLLRAWEIRTPSPDLINWMVERDPESEIAHASSDRRRLEEWLYDRDLIDVLQSSENARPTAQDLPRLLRPLQARQFSISSSPMTKPSSVELTVATVRHGADRERGGVATTYLADRVGMGGEVLVHLMPNSAFGLPEDDETPIILIGPGTGIAPFRGFLQERRARNARGRTWLFFGDQRRSCDFLYESEIDAAVREGVLTKLDLAFSRDQASKDYVQNRIIENGSELFSWLEDGAVVYVCGDAARMAKDVEHALLQVIEQHGDHDKRSATEYLEKLIVSKRYLRDIY